MTHQVHICELGVNGEPIVLDTVTSDDYQWQDSGEAVDVFVNSA